MYIKSRGNNLSKYHEKRENKERMEEKEKKVLK